MKNTFMKLFFIAIAMIGLGSNTFAQVPAYVPKTGLVAWYPFSGNANDQGGNFINGIVSGASLTTDRFAAANSAYSFNGTSDYIEIPYNSLFDNSNYSFSFWVKDATTTSGTGGSGVNPAVLSRLAPGGPGGGPGQSDNWAIYENAGTLHMSTAGGAGGSGAAYTVTTMTDNAWHHIVYSVTSTTFNSYLDGVLKESNSYTTPITYQNYVTRIGLSLYTYWSAYAGSVDDIAIYNKALTQCEVLQLFNGSVPTVLPVTGPSTVCPGNTITLADATSGGIWSSSNSAIANVGTGGVVTGVSAGNAIISYGVVTAGCTYYSKARIIVGQNNITTIAGTGTIGYSGDGAAATAALLHQPHGLAVDATGNIYIDDDANHVIRMINTSGVITTIAGTGTAGTGADGIAATASALNSPFEVALDGAGNFYISDALNHRIRKVNSSGIVTTIAGTGTAGFFGDNGPATAALLNTPGGIAIDANGNIYIGDINNNRVRKINPSGIITTFAGTGAATFTGDGGAAATATLHSPNYVHIDPSGNVVITDNGNHCIRSVNSAGIISRIAGNGSAGNFGDGGAATSARLNFPGGVNYDGAGNLYIADYSNNKIRIVNTSGVINTYAGTGFGGYTGDNGPATAARFTNAVDVALDANQNLLVADYNNNVVRKINPVNPVVAAIGGSPTFCQGVDVAFTDATAGGTWSSSNTAIVTIGSATGYANGVSAGTATISYSVNFTCGSFSVTLPVTVNPFSGGVIVGPNIVCPGNNITLTDATSGGTWSSSNTSIATVSGGVVTGVAAGYAVISYAITNGCGTIAARSLITVGNPIINTIAGTGTAGYLGDGSPATAAQVNGPSSTVMDGVGNIFFTDYANNCIRKINTSGIISTIAGTGTAGYSGDGSPATGATLRNPIGLVLDATGNVIFADYSNHVVRKINTLGIISTIAGTGTGGYTADGIPATTSRLNHPVWVIVDPTGNVIISDASNQRIRKVDLSGNISTIAGNGFTGFTGDGNFATGARLNNPFGICFDPSGNLIIADQVNNRIRKVNSFGIISTIAGTGAASYTGDGLAATVATFNTPACVYYDVAGNLNIADRINNCVRQVNSMTGIISTIAGTGVSGYSGDGGAPATAKFNNVPAIYSDAAGNLYVCDFNNNRLRMVAPVDATVAPITGLTSICQGATTPLADATTGGTWSSSNSSIATVGTTGIVTGVAGGTVTISYSVLFNCGLLSATQAFTVNPLPAVPAAITGTSIVCIGATTSLNDVTPGGTWTSTAISIATIGSLSGIVNGVSAGTATISYTITNSCGSNAATTIVTVNPSSGSVSGTSNICVGASTALTGSPLGGSWTSSSALIATVGSSSGTVNGVAAGNVNITYTYGGGCTAVFPMTINPSPGPITGTASVCVGATTTLADGGLGTWTSGSTGIATVVAGTGVVTGVAPGTSLITYTLPTGCSISATVTVNAAPAAITPAGPVSVCEGATASLGDPTPGGTWSSGAVGTATVGTSGTVTGVAAGTATISYTNGLGCSALKVVTVNITPSALSPTSASVCIGSNVTFTDLVAGGVWTSSAPGTASVVGGIVTGVATGTTNINYTIGTCAVSAPVTVNANPAAITPPGPIGICVGATTTLADGTPGGTWSSGSVGIATVGTSGVVTGVAAGTANISYTIASGCSAVKAITVNITPVALVPSSTIVCTGATVTLTDAVPGGTWSSSAPGVASVVGGVVTGVTVGTATIIYTIGTCAANATVTVNLSPNAGTISGPTTVCTGSPVTLTDPAIGGIWSSSDPSIASVGSTGIVDGVSVGSATISYSVTNSCGTAVATSPMTVSVAASAGTIIGLSMMCAGTFTTMVDVTPGGVWSAVNGNASVSGTGIVTGITPGVDTILYTVSNACGPVSATHVITVGPFLSAGTISGPTTVCQGASIVLSDPSPGGTWSASNANATVSGGTVTGVSGGLVTISYTVTSGCGSASATQVVNVIPTPDAGVISGPIIMCAGMTATYTDPVVGGIWGTTNPIVTITGGGLVTAVFTGTDTITYDYTNACGTASTTIAVTVGPAISAGTISGPLNVCEAASITLIDAAPGGVWTASNGNATVAGGVVTGVTSGMDTISYTVSSTCGSVAATAVVTVNPIPNAGIITGPTDVCVGLTITLSDPAPGGTWSGSNANATVAAGVVTGVTTGTDVISYTVANSCGSVSATSLITIGVSPVVAAIAGPGNVCVGATTTLTDATIGGTWAVSNANATIAAGVVTGVAAGMDTVSYTVSTGCGTAVATAVVTVNPLPVVGTIAGPTDVCAGSVITLTDAAPGGTWSASNANATVVGGVVTGVTAGTDIISYSVTNGCGTLSATSTITINPMPDAGAITGGTNVCTGAPLLLSDLAPGGTWSASNGNATISGGLITGVSAGMDTISYTVSNGCGIAIASVVVTIGSLPSVASISGLNTVCKTASITLSDATAGGTWSSSNSRATVTSAGVVTGVIAGLDTILYTVSNVCGSASATKVISITQPPSAGTITGATSVCAGLTTTLSDATSGGTWSSSNSAAATVNATGLVTGIAGGTATISYTVSNTCGNRSATHAVLVMTPAQCNAKVNGAANIPADELQVYPNPNQGIYSMNLITQSEEPVRVVITNIIGKQVKEFITTTNKITDIQMNTAPGIYILTATTANGRYVTKVTVE